MFAFITNSEMEKHSGKGRFLHRLEVGKLRNIRWKNSRKIKTLKHTAISGILTLKY